MPRLIAVTFRLYGDAVRRRLDDLGAAGVYHFRAGFGHSSIGRARELGMVTLCDHTIAHPLLMGPLLDRHGHVEEAAVQSAVAGERALEPYERAVLSDIRAADAVLVNSEFVKRTFTALGADPARIHVLYLGVDDNFVRALGTRARTPASGPLRLLFAGRLEPRKGADALVAALTGLSEPAWELTVAGPVDGAVASAHGAFLADARVRLRGVLPRAQLVTEMLAAPVFVFPSYAEGSARVVFEAMACGCYVITSPNAGSVVEDGVHGALVEPWDVEGLRCAIREAAGDPDRVCTIGRRNAAVIRERFRQRDYGERLCTLYRALDGAGVG